MTKSRRSSHWVVGSIIVLAMAVLLLNPRGIVGRWIADIYEKRQERHRTSEIWPESTATLGLSTDTLFDSSAHPNEVIASLARLEKAMFLPNDRLLIQDRVWFHFVEIQTGKVTTVGERGAGPGEFQAPFEAVRSANGIVIWDLVLGRLTTLSETGEYLGSRQFDIAQLKSPVAPLVAAFGDGSVVFRDDSTSAFGIPPSGLYREPARYVKISQDGHNVVIHNARGPETVHEEPRQASMIFAHNVLDATLGNAIVVAQTDLPAISVFDSNGSVISQLPMPEMIDVSRDQIESARDSAIEDERRRTSRLSRRLGYPINDNLLSHDIPANDPAPPIDRMFADLDGRLWLRKYQLPDETIGRWEAWNVDDVKPDVRLDIHKVDGTLLDINGDKALLHVQDEFNVDRVIVRRIGIVERSSGI